MARECDWQGHYEVLEILKYVTFYRKIHGGGPGKAQPGGDEWGETQQYVWGTLVYTPEFEGDWLMLSDEGWRAHIRRFITLNPVVQIIPRET